MAVLLQEIVMHNRVGQMIFLAHLRPQKQIAKCLKVAVEQVIVRHNRLKKVWTNESCGAIFFS